MRLVPVARPISPSATRSHYTHGSKTGCRILDGEDDHEQFFHPRYGTIDTVADFCNAAIHSDKKDLQVAE